MNKYTKTEMVKITMFNEVTSIKFRYTQSKETKISLIKIIRHKLDIVVLNQSQATIQFSNTTNYDVYIKTNKHKPMINRSFKLEAQFFTKKSSHSNRYRI